MTPYVFSVVRELSRREVERHAKRFIGITISEPVFKDQNGLTEWVVDIRVGVKEDWAVIRDCLIAQWALGIVTDMNIPVIAEKSEAGRVTIIARSQVHLPHITLDYYNYEDLEFGFMRNLVVHDDGQVTDGFGYEFAPVGSGSYNPSPSPPTETRTFRSELIEWRSTDFDYGITPWRGRREWWDVTYS